MFGIWDVRDIEGLGCEMLRMWDIRNVECLLRYGMLVYKMPFRDTDFSISVAVSLKFSQVTNLFQQIMKKTWQGNRMKVTH